MITKGAEAEAKAPFLLHKRSKYKYSKISIAFSVCLRYNQRQLFFKEYLDR